MLPVLFCLHNSFHKFACIRLPRAVHLHDINASLVFSDFIFFKIISEKKAYLVKKDSKLLVFALMLHYFHSKRRPLDILSLLELMATRDLDTVIDVEVCCCCC